MVMWESRQWLGKNIVGSTGLKTPGKHGLVNWLPRYKWNIVENAVKHHTINQQSPFLVIFSKPLFFRVQANNGLFGNGLTLSQTCPCFKVSPFKSFENTVGKGEIACNKQLLLFLQCFCTPLENSPPFSLNLKLSSVNSFSLEESKLYCLGNGLTK